MNNLRSWKRFLSLIIMVCCIFCMGCFKGESDVTIAEDGSVTVKNTVMGIPLMKDQIDRIKKEALEKNSSASVKEVSDGNMKGYEIDAQYGDIQALAQNGGKIFSAVNGKSKGIQQHQGWFFDTYSFDFCMEGRKQTSKSSEDDEMMESMTKAMLSQVKFDFTLNLPYAPEHSNADKMTNENKTLFWNLASALTDTNDKSMQVTFRIWHKERVVGTIVVAVLLLILLVVFIWRTINSNDDAAQKKTNSALAILSGCLLLLLAAVSMYLFYGPVHFSDGDILSPTVEQSATAEAEKKDETPKTDASSAEHAVVSKSVAGQDVLQRYAGRKDQYNGDIAALANDINGYLGSHANFRGTNTYNQRANAIYQQIRSTRNDLQGEVGVDSALKGQLIELLTAEMDRVQGLRDGVNDSKNGHGYTAGFQRGGAASDRFDGLDAKFKQAMP